MDEILNDVLQEAKPDEKEREQLSETSQEVKERVEEVSSELDVSVKPKLVGSAARKTWISGEQDIDLFLLFPEDTSREKLEELGLEIGKRVAKGKGSEQYAEHPYINAIINDYDVDIVPCYDIEDSSELKSAVDRSPHHQKFIQNNIDSEKANQVLILKKFLKSIKAYGSELKVHGFSGYLCELLIIKFGSFKKLIKSAKDWGDQKIIAPDDDRSKEDLQKIFPKDPLIFIDPVDPSRNVAAALSKKNYAKFVRAAEEFVQNPSKNFFTAPTVAKSEEEIRKILEKRKTKLFLITLEIKYDLVPDIIFPQLRKTEKKLREKLEMKEFQPLRSEVWSEGKKAAIIIEVEYPKLSKVKKHIGPPLGIDAKPFIEKHLNSEEKLSGPFINEEGRLVFELERSPRTAKEVLKWSLESGEGFGKHVAKSVEKEGYEIFEDEETVGKARELGALEFLGKYLTHCLPWYR